MAQKDRLTVLLSPNPTTGQWCDAEWAACISITCNSLPDLMRDGAFPWTPAEYIQTEKTYVTDDAKARLLSSSWHGNFYSYHQIISLAGPTPKKTTRAPKEKEIKPKKWRSRFGFGGKKKDSVEQQDEEEEEVISDEPEWTGTLHISANSYGTLSRSGIDEWNYAKIFKATGERRDDAGQLRMVYNYVCVGDQNINSILGPRRALTGFWPWPREEHVQKDVSGGPVLSATDGERKQETVGGDGEGGGSGDRDCQGVADQA